MTTTSRITSSMRRAWWPLACALLVWQLGAASHAHSGRRFQVGVEDGRLVAQGVITSGVDDGGGVVRPYQNVLHDHWSNSPLIGLERASSTLPGFDVPGPAPSELRFHSLRLEVKSASRWLSPPAMVGPDTTPTLTAITGAEGLSMTLGGQSIVPGDGQTLLLDPSIAPGGSLDIDPLYSINEIPTDKLYVLELELTTSAPGVAASDPVYVVLSPDGGSPAERLHHTSLFLEEWLAASGVPEPCASALVTIAVAAFFGRARQSRTAKPTPRIVAPHL